VYGELSDARVVPKDHTALSGGAAQVVSCRSWNRTGRNLAKNHRDCCCLATARDSVWWIIVVGHDGSGVHAGCGYVIYSTSHDHPARHHNVIDNNH